jgi:hypothetical protein
MIRISPIALAAGLAFFPAVTSAATITFEDLAVASGVNDIGGDQVSGGFLFNSLTNHTHLTNDTFGASNGTTYLITDNFNGENPLTMTPVGGGTFSLLSVDFSEWIDASEAASQIRITGVGGSGPSMTITLDGIFDGVGGQADFETVLFGAGWSNLTAVIFDGVAGGTTGNQYFGIDNLVVDAEVVPEPASLLLLGGGLTGLAARWRRHRKNS